MLTRSQAPVFAVERLTVPSEQDTDHRIVLSDGQIEILHDSGQFCSCNVLPVEIVEDVVSVDTSVGLEVKFWTH
jgi:hypothetical protein